MERSKRERVSSAASGEERGEEKAYLLGEKRKEEGEKQSASGSASDRAEEAVVWGWHSVTALLRIAPQRVVTIYLDADRRDGRARALRQRAEGMGVPLVMMPRTRLTALAGSTSHQGVVAVVRPRSPLSLSAVLRTTRGVPLFLILDGVTDPHNLGAALRTADATGVTALIAPKDRSCGLTPVVTKVACGAAETVPLLFVTNLARALRELQRAGVWVVGLAGDAPESLFSCDLRGPTALVVGSEGEGLRQLTRACCDQVVRLPMAGCVESLNVAVAAGVALYEAVRQRMKEKSAS
ncbi:MAG: 23S rRNA (guanosine(2251)-2'-O)-methyltransferase RlmB [Hydrogenophilus sp.]|nr:23S rRNA (guanosine(2251)-2'-O)-methyltransferase RlmB [Hydrogenophilus sp.]